MAPTAGGRGGGGSSRDVKGGPPAPVPPQVAILRPSPEELEKLNGELKRYVCQNFEPLTAALKAWREELLQAGVLS